MTWSEHPFFVPFGDDQLACVATVPSTAPEGLAVLLQGLGAPRSHRYSLWTRIAREVASAGLATVRFDYRGMGDSTGAFVADLTQPPVSEGIAVVERTMDVLGISRFATVGNCMGARVALGVGLGHPSCVGIGCVVHNHPKEILVGFGRSRSRRLASSLASRLPRRGKSNHRLTRARVSAPASSRFIPQVHEAIDRVGTLFLFIGPEDVGRALETGISGLGNGRRSVVEVLPDEPTPGFQLRLEIQDQVAARVSGWLASVLLSGDQVGQEEPTNAEQGPG